MGNLSKETNYKKNQMEMVGLQLTTTEVKKNSRHWLNRRLIAHGGIKSQWFEEKSIEMIQYEEQSEKR